MAKAGESQPNKHEALNSNSNITKKKNKKKTSTIIPLYFSYDFSRTLDCGQPKICPYTFPICVPLLWPISISKIFSYFF
jgi:hypothetical protein